MFTLSSGDALLVGPGIQHELWQRTGEDLEAYTLKFHMAGQPMRQALPSVLRCHLTQGRRVEQLLDDIIEEASLGDESEGILIRQKIVELFLLLSREIRRTISERDGEAAQIRKWIDDVVRHMKLNASQSFDIQSLVDMTPWCRTRFFQHFKKRVGHTPNEYHLVLRVRRAEHLFRVDPELSVKQVAGYVGFDDPYYFSRTFKRINGTSPLAYVGRFRKRNKAR